MKREVRDRMVQRTTHALAANAAWETPPRLYQKLNDLFRFDVDLCAAPGNAKHRVWLGPGSGLEADATRGDWGRFGRVGFANPPYGEFLKQILPVAVQEAQQGFTSVWLLPLRITQVFQATVLLHATALWLCDRRIAFYEQGRPRMNPVSGRPDTALFDACVAVFQPGHLGNARPMLDVWTVPQEEYGDVDATLVE